MKRPAHLPDYGSPPLNEVALGIQYRQPEGYQQIRAGEVWSLFRQDFPIVEEQQAMAPVFETFGPLKPATPTEFQFLDGAQHDRFWFVNQDGDELIQFQSDRLFHNWRKRPGVDRPYPRFEPMIEAFQSDAEKIERFFASIEPQALDITQAEIAYINHFPTDEDPDFSRLDDYLHIVHFGDDAPEAASLRYKRVIAGRDGKPLARLHVETNVGLTAAGKVVMVVNLTMRGAPVTSTIAGAVDLLSLGREVIVNEFTAITTGKAHQLWNRK